MHGFPQELRFPTQVASIRGFPKGQSKVYSFEMCIGLQGNFVSRHTDFFSLVHPPSPSPPLFSSGDKGTNGEQVTLSSCLFWLLAVGEWTISKQICLGRAVSARTRSSTQVEREINFRVPVRSGERPSHQTPLMESPVLVNTCYQLSGSSEKDEKVHEA